jgi:hypothetical protein
MAACFREHKRTFDDAAYEGKRLIMRVAKSGELHTRSPAGTHR